MATNVVTTLATVPNTSADKILYGPADWTAMHTLDAAVAAVVAGVTGVQHFIRHVTVTFSAAPADGTLQIKDGSAVIWQANLAALGPLVYVFDFSRCPLQATEGAAISANVSDPGGAVVATCAVIGFSSRRIAAFS